MHEIFTHIKEAIRLHTSPSEKDSFLINGGSIGFDRKHFVKLGKAEHERTITYIDGGQAELLKAPNFSLQLIRVAACTFKGKKRISQQKHEFYVLAYTNPSADINYSAKIYPINDKPLFGENLLNFGSMDPTIRNGTERADISRIGSAARRFAELSVAAAQSQSCDYIVIDGNLEASFTHEQQIIDSLPKNVAAMAKTTGMFTADGNSAAALLSEYSPEDAWVYSITQNGRQFISCVKLHPKSDYIFRFETFDDKKIHDILACLASQSSDPVFLGYPYGLVWADRMARISNQELDSFKTQLFVSLGKDALKIKKYLNAANAHEILDNIG